MRQDLIDTYYRAAVVAETRPAFRAVLAIARLELTAVEYLRFLAKLSSGMEEAALLKNPPKRAA